MRYLPVSSQAQSLREDNPGVGQESQFIKRYREKLIMDYYSPISRQWTNSTLRFYNLKEEWEDNTAGLSSITEISMHPSYQQIIGMGPVAIPFIMYELSLKPSHWFWALKSITGEDPVDQKQRGNIKNMTDAWVNWGRIQGYV